MKQSFAILLIFLSLRAATAQTPGSDVMVTLSASGSDWQGFTYQNSDRVDLITNRITASLTFHPSSPQAKGYYYSSTTADFEGSINIITTAIVTENGSSTSDTFQNQVTYTEPGFPVDSDFFGPQFSGSVKPGDLADLTVAPPTGGGQSPQPYRLFYDGTNNTLTVWISLPSPFDNYPPYPSDDEAYTIPCAATVSGDCS